MFLTNKATITIEITPKKEKKRISIKSDTEYSKLLTFPPTTFSTHFSSLCYPKQDMSSRFVEHFKAEQTHTPSTSTVAYSTTHSSFEEEGQAKLAGKVKRLFGTIRKKDISTQPSSLVSSQEDSNNNVSSS